MFIDSHRHLSFPELVSQMPAIRQAMADARVDRARVSAPPWKSLVTCTPWHWPTTTSGAPWACTPDNEGVQEPSVEDLLAKAALPRVVAIGETGLDYYGMEDRKGGRSAG